MEKYKLDFINHKRNPGHRFNAMQLSNDLFAIFNSTYNDYFDKEVFVKFCKYDASLYIKKLVPGLREVKHIEVKVQTYLYGQTLQNKFILTYDDDITGDYLFNLNWFIKPIAGN